MNTDDAAPFAVCAVSIGNIVNWVLCVFCSSLDLSELAKAAKKKLQAVSA